jgi:hypothetical protein
MCSEPSRLSRSRDGGKRSMEQDSVVQSDVARWASMVGKYSHCIWTAMSLSNASMKEGRRLPCPTSASGCRDGGRQGRRDVGTWAHGRLDA